MHKAPPPPHEGATSGGLQLKFKQSDTTEDRAALGQLFARPGEGSARFFLLTKKHYNIPGNFVFVMTFIEVQKGS